nr:MAG TPA: hypothetical protein [Caudoviricetes sp.]
MAIPKPITRVEQYLASIAGASDVTLPAYPITREEYYLASWAEKSGFEIAEVDGTPPLVLKDCIGEQFKGLVLYGKSTQVTTTGAQLLDIPDYTGISRGVTVTVKEGLISLHGTCTETGWILIERVTPVSLDGVYILSVYGADKRVTLVTEKYIEIMNSTSASTVNNSIAKRIAFSAKKGEVLNVDGIKVMLNAGDTALPWEPYTGGKPSPSPDYPQEIVSAGDDGSIGIEVHGKNIFGGRYYYANYANNILQINGNRKEEEVKLPYAPERENFGVCKVIKCKKGKTYVISVTNPNKNATIGMAEYENIENASAYTKNVGFARMTTKTKQLYTAKSDGILVCGIAGTWTDGKTTVHECTESELLQVEEASEATTYEPYRPSQTFTITSPTSLPGIPVPSGGNYTDETGQQWICDEVDLERGVYVQRIYTVDVTELEYSAGTILQTVKRIFYKISVPSTGTTNKGYCTRLTYSANYSADNPHFYINEERIVVFIPLDTTIKPKEYLVQYVLATPIETPLSETDIAAYRALTTYKGTTILESECYLKVKYSKLRK